MVRFPWVCLVLCALTAAACGRGDSNVANANAPAPVFDRPSTLMDPPLIWREMPEDELLGWIMQRNRDWVDFYGYYAPARMQLAKLTPGQRALYSCQWLDYEVRNGGFFQFFDNSTGMIGPEALEGFKLFGMDQAAKAIQAAFDFAKFDPYPRERQERQKRMPEYEGNNDKWWALDEAYYVATKDKSTPDGFDNIVAAKIVAYIRAHPEQFFKGD